MATRVLVLTVLALSLLPLSAFGHDESHYCSAQIIFRDGQFNQQMRVECDGPYAGKCLQEVSTDGQWNWQVVSDAICDEKAKSQ